ncbi:uncharacterized protein L3040_001999 [Drepanopeziza brunnea f. sp. 'multigermtubi']|nr:hypothetical protein L3040_001999 [Drepanopeziza brunnea f. sp. 'multigermtubi']
MQTMPELSPESSSTSRPSANHPNGPSKTEAPPSAPQPVKSLSDNLDDLRFETTHRLDALETSDSTRGLRLDYHDAQLEQLAKKASDLKVQVTRLVSLEAECAAKLKALGLQIDEERERRSGGNGEYTNSAASLVHEAHRARLEDLERRMEKGSQVISAVAAAILGLEEQVQAADEMRKLIFESVVELEAELPAIKTAVTELDVKTEEGLAKLDQKVTKLDDDSNIYLEALNNLGQRYNQLDLAVEALERHNETVRDSHEDGAVEAHFESLKTAQDEILATHDTLVQNHGTLNDRLERVESWCDNASLYDTAMESRISELEVARVETKSTFKNLRGDQKSLRIRLDQVEQGEQDLKAATGSIPAIDSRLGDLEASKTQVLSANEKLDQNQNVLRKRIESVETACLSQLKRIDKMQGCITTTINSVEHMNGQLGDHTKHIESIRGKYKHIVTWYKYFDEVTKTQKVLIEELQAEANRQLESDVAFKLDIESRIKQLITDNQKREDSMMDRIKALECRDKSLSSELAALKHLRASPGKRSSRDSTETPPAPHAKRPRKF